MRCYTCKNTFIGAGNLQLMANNVLREYDDMKEETKNLKTLTVHQRKSPTIVSTNRRKPMLLSKCTVCGSKKLGFIKKQEASEFLSSLGINLLIPKIPFIGDILF